MLNIISTSFPQSHDLYKSNRIGIKEKSKLIPLHALGNYIPTFHHFDYFGKITIDSTYYQLYRINYDRLYRAFRGYHRPTVFTLSNKGVEFKIYVGYGYILSEEGEYLALLTLKGDKYNDLASNRHLGDRDILDTIRNSYVGEFSSMIQLHITRELVENSKYQTLYRKISTELFPKFYDNEIDVILTTRKKLESDIYVLDIKTEFSSLPSMLEYVNKAPYELFFGEPYEKEKKEPVLYDIDKQILKFWDGRINIPAQLGKLIVEETSRDDVDISHIPDDELEDIFREMDEVLGDLD